MAGPLGPAATRALRAQFGQRADRSIPADRTTVLELDGLDQAAIRGVLTLLWDVGHDVDVRHDRSKEHSP